MYIVKRLLPSIAIFSILGLYAVLVDKFITCKKCGSGQSTALYQLDRKTANLSNINATLEEEYAKLEANSNSNSANTAVKNVPPAPTEAKKETVRDPKGVSPAAKAGAANSANANAETPKQTASPAATPKSLTEKEKLEQEIRGKAAARYSFKNYWIFLSGILLFLSFAAVAVGLNILLHFYSNRMKWVWISASLVAALAASGWICFHLDKYMALILPMLDQSLAQAPEMKWWIHFFNVGGLAATAFFVVASAGLYWHVSVKKETATKQTSYDDERLFAKTILYVGAAMLFVSMLRMDLMFDWHLNYVADHLRDGLSKFFSSVLAVQAAFYTILLGIVYLPFASLPKKGDAAKEKAGEPTAGGKMFAILPDPLPKLLAIISPFLAGPIAELVKFFTGG